MVVVMRMSRVLISLVKPRRYLFDPRHPDYQKRNVRDKAWEEIGKEMGIDAAEVRKQWTMLRQYTTNHREKLKLPSGSAASAHSQKKKKQNWEYAADIQFLLQHLRQHRHMSGNLSTASKASKDEDLLRYAMMENDIPDSVEPTTPSSRDIEPNTPSSQDIEPNRPSSQDIQSTRRPKKKKNDDGEEALEKYCDAMVTIARGREAERPENPEIGWFKSLLPQIKLLDPLDTLNFKTDVQVLLQKYLTKKATP